MIIDDMQKIAVPCKVVTESSLAELREAMSAVLDTGQPSDSPVTLALAHANRSIRLMVAIKRFLESNGVR